MGEKAVAKDLWVLVRWDGDRPLEVCRQPTWAGADAAREAATLPPGCLSIEDVSVWEANRPR